MSAITIFNMSSLKTIDFSTNNLSGPLSSDMFSHLPSVQELYLSWNRLFGPFPSNLFLCKELILLSLSFNNFEGTIPAEIGNLTKLYELYIGFNNFKGMSQLLTFENCKVPLCPPKSTN